MAIDIDENYVRITREKIAEVERKGYIERQSIRKPQRKYTKKELQLELRDLAAELGRLPTPDDVQKMSEYDLEVFFNVFPTWGTALRTCMAVARQPAWLWSPRRSPASAESLPISLR